jgi:hypothetical protein
MLESRLLNIIERAAGPQRMSLERTSGNSKTFVDAFTIASRGAATTANVTITGSERFVRPDETRSGTAVDTRNRLTN